MKKLRVKTFEEAALVRAARHVTGQAYGPGEVQFWALVELARAALGQRGRLAGAARKVVLQAAAGMLDIQPIQDLTRELKRYDLTPGKIPMPPTAKELAAIMGQQSGPGRPCSRLALTAAGHEALEAAEAVTKERAA